MWNSPYSHTVPVCVTQLLELLAEMSYLALQHHCMKKKKNTTLLQDNRKIKQTTTKKKCERVPLSKLGLYLF